MVSPRNSIRGLILVTVGLIGISVLALGATIWSLRSDATEQAMRDSEHIATILADQTEHSVAAIQSLLTEVQERVAALHVEKPDDLSRLAYTEEMYRFLKDRSSLLPQADVITLQSSDGALVNSTRAWPRAQANFYDRDYFQHFLAVDDPNVYISLPMTSRLAGTRVLYFNKRLNSENGEFIGVVSVGVEIGYFRHIYESMTALGERSFLLLRRDGTVMVRYPDSVDRAGSELPATSPWHDVILQGGGSYSSRGHFDGRQRLISVRPLRDHPLVVNVTMAESAALRIWQRRTLAIGLGALLVVCCAVFLLRALVRQIRRLSDSEQRLVEKSGELEGANQRLDAALNNMSHGLCMFDAAARLIICNERYQRMYGLSAEDTVPGRPLRLILDSRKAVGTFDEDPVAYIATLRAQLANGESPGVTSRLQDGRVILVHNQQAGGGARPATHEDITARERSEALIAHMASHDPLTGLANRRLFRERMDQALGRLQRSGEGFGVFVFDLDLFKAVNDSLGHPIGDALLKAVSDRLRDSVPPGYTVGRLGGDEFAILQTESCDQRENAIMMASKLSNALVAPYSVEGHQIVIGISVGIALAPRDGTEAEQLLKNADLALYRVKTEGRNGYRFYEPEMDADIRVRREFELDLRDALSRQEFELHYQTIIDAGSGAICGVEALVRWQHPLHGTVRPDQFIPLAEELGLIIPIGEWILRRGCMDAVAWPEHVKLAINLSPVQFRNGHLVEIVANALVDSGLPPSRLELEITESILLQKNASNISILNQLKGLGVGIVLDDFGTGFSSLSYLRMFAFDKVKIDRSFVADLSTRADCAAIVCAITGLGRSLQIDTTAEGVETQEQFDLLRAAGCTQAQGFFFSRPAPIARARSVDGGAGRGWGWAGRLRGCAIQTG